MYINISLLPPITLKDSYWWKTYVITLKFCDEHLSIATKLRQNSGSSATMNQIGHCTGNQRVSIPQLSHYSEIECT